MNDARLSARSECYGTALRKASRRVTALYDETLAPSGCSQIKAGNATHTPSRSGRRLKTGTPPLSVKPKPTSFDNAYSRSDTATN